MKKIFSLHYILTIVVMAIFMTSCIITKPTIALKRAKGLEVDTSRIYKDVVSLTGINPPRNNKNIASLNKAFDYIHNELDELDCVIDTQKYSFGNREFKNLIASFNIKAKERIIIGAHYDVCEDSPGADDNASGVAVILGVARLIDSLKPGLNYRVDIIAYSTEEPPYNGVPMGSWIHALSVKNNNVELKTAIVLDMVGYYSSEKGSQDYPPGIIRFFYPSKADFALIVTKFRQGRQGKKLKKRCKQAGDMRFRSLNAPDTGGLYSSDHGNYWLMGLNAMLITNTATYRNENYHEITDTPETLNYANIGELIKGVYYYVSRLR